MGTPLFTDAEIARHEASGAWGTETLATVVAERARTSPDGLAYVSLHRRLTWAGYDRRADELAGVLRGAGLVAGDRVGVLLADGPLVHEAFLGVERAGLVTVGIGSRAGDAEIAHLLGLTRARGLVTAGTHRGRTADQIDAALDERGAEVPIRLVVDDAGAPAVARGAAVGGAGTGAPDGVGPNDLWMVNSTSGTTGRPKCVLQHQNRWSYFHQLAVSAGELRPDDVLMSLIPAPFGFGIWTSHVTPALLGTPCVVLDHFDAAVALGLIERERVTVLCCVSTQFHMLLDHPASATTDFGPLRVMFTGGEAVSRRRAGEFEERTGAKVLQFFGSNETGALSCTTVRDPRPLRLGTAGRVIPGMHVRLFDEAGRDVTDSGGPAIAAGRGPALCAGYLDDPDANRQLFTEDGWMLMGDLVTIDGAGYVRVVGRSSDIVIRGGKNLSAVQIEEEVGTHPAVELVAVVAVPDEVFGERAGAYVTLRPGATLDLATLGRHLDGRGVGRELHPEHLFVVDSLPRSSGGKVAKGELRSDARRRAARSSTSHSTYHPASHEERTCPM